MKKIIGLYAIIILFLSLTILPGCYPNHEKEIQPSPVCHKEFTTTYSLRNPLPEGCEAYANSFKAIQYGGIPYNPSDTHPSYRGINGNMSYREVCDEEVTAEVIRCIPGGYK